MAGGLGEALAGRPRGAAAVGCVLLAAALGLAVGAPERLPVGPIQVKDGAAPAELVMRVQPADPRSDARVQRVALDVISSRLRADPSAERVEAVRSPTGVDFVVTLGAGGWDERVESARRIGAEIDPGPLDVQVRGQLAELDGRRQVVGGDLWRLELAALPLLFLVLAALLGARPSLAALGAAALGIAGCAAGLRLLAGVLDVSSIGLMAGAPVALVVAIEAVALLARQDHAARAATPLAALAGAPAAAVGAGAVLPPLLLVVTPIEQVASAAFGCALAAALALTGAGLFGPWAIRPLRTPADPARGARRAPVATLAGTALVLAALAALAHAALARPPAGGLLGVAPATDAEAAVFAGALGAVLAVVGTRTALALSSGLGTGASTRHLGRGYAASTAALLVAAGVLAAGDLVLGGAAEPEVELYGVLVAGGALCDLVLLRVPAMLLAARVRRAPVVAAG